MALLKAVRCHSFSTFHVKEIEIWSNTQTSQATSRELKPQGRAFHLLEKPSRLMHRCLQTVTNVSDEENPLAG
jgi:hypothetical protein